MTDRDPFELLGQLDWQYRDEPLKRGENPALDDLVLRIVNPPRRGAALSVFGVKVRYWIAGLAAVALAGTGATAAATLLGRADDPSLVTCYSNAAINPNSQVTARTGKDLKPVDQCTPFWKDGTLGTEGPPALVACVTDSEIIAVMPGTADTCIAIGLDPFGTPDPLDEPAIAIAEAATTVLLDECFSDLNQARQAVLDALDGLGAADWTVRVEGATDAARPCAGTLVDPARRTIVIAPVLRPPR